MYTRPVHKRLISTDEYYGDEIGVAGIHTLSADKNIAMKNRIISRDIYRHG